jgi:hypothetical protein
LPVWQVVIELIISLDYDDKVNPLTLFIAVRALGMDNILFGAVHRHVSLVSCRLGRRMCLAHCGCLCDAYAMITLYPKSIHRPDAS